MNRATRWLKWGMHAIGMAVVLLVLLGVVGYVWLQTESGRRHVGDWVANALSAPGATEISIGDLDPGLPVRIGFSGLRIRDADGVWLEVASASLVWKPLALFLGRLEVASLAMSNVRLLRVPEKRTPGEPPSEPFQFPSLPVAVSVHGIAICEIQLGPRVIGEAVSFCIKGQLALGGPGPTRTDLTVERADAKEGRATIVVNWDPRTENLDIRTEVVEPEGGIIARALNLASYPPISFLAEGHGPLPDWKGTIAARALGLAELNAEVLVARKEDVAVHLAGHAAVAELLDPALRPAVEPGIDFNLALRYDEDGQITLERAEFGTKEVRVKGVGRFNIESAAIDADLALEITPTLGFSALLEPASLRRFTALAKVAGNLERPEMALTGSVEGVDGVRAALDRMDWQARIDPIRPHEGDAGGFKIEAKGKANGVRTGDAVLGALIGEAATWSLGATFDPAGGVINVRSAEINGRTLGLKAHGRVGYSGGTTEVALTATVPELSALAPATGLPLAGRFHLDVSAAGDVPAGSLAGAIKAKLERLSTGQPAADALLAPDVAVQADYALEGGKTLRIAQVAVRSEGLRADGNAVLEFAFGSLNATYQIEAPSLARLGQALNTPMQGSAVIDGTAEGKLADPSVVAALLLDDATIGGVPVQSAAVKVTASQVVSQPSGRVLASVEGDDLRGTAQAAFAAVEGKRIRISDIALQAPGLSLGGNITAPLTAGLYHGRLSARLDAPEGGMALAGHQIKGRADVDVRLEEAGNGQGVALKADASGLAVTLKNGSTFALERFNAAGNATDVFRKPRGQLTVSAAKAGYGGSAIDAFDARLDGAPTNAQFRVRIDGFAGRPGQLRTQGRLAAMEDGVTRVTANLLSGTLGHHTLSLAAPALVEYGPGQLALDNLDLRIDSGRLRADGRLAPGATSARIIASALPLSLADIVWPEAAPHGEADATIEVKTEGAGLGGNLDLHIHSVGSGATSKLGLTPVSGSVGARWTGGIIAAEARFSGLPGGGGLTFSGGVPLTVDSQSLEPVIDPNAPIVGHMAGEAELGPLWEVLPLGDQRLMGRADLNLTFSGTLGAPRVQGEAGLSQGTYEHFMAGTVLKNLTVAARADETSRVTITLGGTDGGSGRLSGQGAVVLPPQDALRVDMTVSMEEATLVRRDDATATMSGQVNYRTADAKQRITGQIETSGVELRLVDRLPPSVIQLDVTEINRPGPMAVEAGESVERATAASVDLDVVIDMPRRVFVRGRGLESEWSGHLSVTGNTNTPSVIGTIELLRGNFDVVGKRFDLQKGLIGFAGGKSIDPKLDIVAERDAGEITAVITVSGTASKPSIELSSRPPVPESEILAQALFGKSTAKLGPVEALQVAATLNALARGDGASEDVLGSVRTFLGLDVLTVGAGETEGQGPTVEVGRYIGDRIYVGAEQGTTPGSGQGTVEVEIAPGITVETDVGQSQTGTTGSLGVKWKWDY